MTALLTALVWLGPGDDCRASFYGASWNGRQTASGAIYNCMEYTAASPTLPFGALVLVCHGGRAVVVEIQDRGPFAVDGNGRVTYPLRPHETRQLDLSLESMKRLGGIPEGVIDCRTWRVR